MIPTGRSALSATTGDDILRAAKKKRKKENQGLDVVETEKLDRLVREKSDGCPLYSLSRSSALVFFYVKYRDC